MSQKFTSKITQELQNYINEREARGEQVTFDDIEATLSIIMDRENSRPLEKFLGYSPSDMAAMLYHPFGIDCPVKIRGNLSEDQLSTLPFYMQCFHLMDVLSKGDVKLTAAGYIPPKYVKELYSLGVPDEFVEKWGYKVSNETKSESVQFVHEALKCSGLIKERKGVMSLTKKGQETLADHNLLNKTVTETLLTRLCLDFFDGYKDREIGNFGTAFSLVIIHKLSPDWHLEGEYAKAYFEAFPDMIGKSDRKDCERCYVSRVMNRLCTNYLGVCEKRYVRPDSPSTFFGHDEYRVLPAFDTLFSFRDTISAKEKKKK